MAIYAMIFNNQIFKIINQDEKPIWPPILEDYPVIAVACSEEVTTDWLYNPETGEVFKPTIIAFEKNESSVKPFTQLILIQQTVEKSNNELRQEGANTAILELIKKGIL